MADILKTLTSNLITFTDGERPSAAKFNALTRYFNRRVSDISRAVGDVYDDNTIEFNKTIRWNHTDGKRRPLDILNLARIIGPSSNLNTRMFSVRKSINETIPQGSVSFKLSYEVSSFTNTYSTINPGFVVLEKLPLFRSSNTFTNENQYYFDIVTNSLIFAKATTADFIATYETDPNTYFGGANYINSQFNVIPDPNATNDKLNIVPVPGTNNTYRITLPALTEQQSGIYDFIAHNDKDLSSTEFNKDLQIYLPDWMWNNDDPSFNYFDGDIIEANFIYLKDRTLDESYLTATYKYVDNKTLEISGVSLCLDDSNDFALVTVGTDITTSIDDLRLKWFRHTHDGTFGEERIDIKNLAGIFMKEHVRLLVPDITFSKSSIEDNHLPMYLHRIGYTTDTSTNNGNNSMLGTLLIGRVAFDYQDIDNQPIQSKDGESWPISFGGVLTNGPYIKRDSDSDLVIKGQVNPKTGSTTSPNINIESSNSINLNAISNSIQQESLLNRKDATYISEYYKETKHTSYSDANNNTHYVEKYSHYELTDTTFVKANDPNEATSINMSSIDSFNSSETFLPVYSEVSELQLIENEFNATYTLEPDFSNDIINDTANHWVRPNMKTVANTEQNMLWLSYLGKITKGNDTIAAPVVFYKDVNIQEFLIPIKEVNFKFKYRKHSLYENSNNYIMPWGQREANDSISTHKVAFGEPQLYSPSINEAWGSYTMSQAPNEDDKFVDEQRRPTNPTPNNEINNINFGIRKHNLYNENIYKRRSYNVIDIQNVFTNVFNTSWSATALDTDSNLISLRNSLDLESSTNNYRINSEFAETLILEKSPPIPNGIDTSNESPKNYWHYIKNHNGMFTPGYFSFSHSGFASTQDVEFGFKYEIKAPINENYAFKFVKKEGGNEGVYWLRGKYLSLNDFNFTIAQSTPSGGPPNGPATSQPWTNYQDYDYTVCGNTVRFHIIPTNIGLLAASDFNPYHYDIYLMHSFENENNTHQTLDNYLWILSEDFQPNNNSPFASYYCLQLNNNHMYKEYDENNFLNRKIFKYSDYKSIIGNDNNNSVNDYLTDNDRFTSLETGDEENPSYYPVPNELKSLPACAEYVNQYFIDERVNNKHSIKRWDSIGENSQYIRITRKLLTLDNVGWKNNSDSIISRYVIDCEQDGTLNEDVFKFSYTNLQGYIEREESRLDEGDSTLSLKNNNASSENIHFSSSPNFIISYMTDDNIHIKEKDDFFFSSNTQNIDADSTYLNNGNLSKNINVYINEDFYGSQKKLEVNLTIYIKRFLAKQFSTYFSTLLNSDFSIQSDSNQLVDSINKQSNIFKSYFFNNYDNKFKPNSLLNDYRNANGKMTRLTNYIQSDNDYIIKYTSNIIENTEIINSHFGINFNLDIKEIISPSSIDLKITFNLTNVNVTNMEY